MAANVAHYCDCCRNMGHFLYICIVLSANWQGSAKRWRCLSPGKNSADAH